MIRALVLSLFLLATFSLQAADYGEFKKIDFSDNKQVIITSWNSKLGLKLFKKAKYKNDFYDLASHFQPQKNPLYCGIASSAIILNALNEDNHIIVDSENTIKKPKIYGSTIIPYNSFTQDDILNKNTDFIKNRAVINFKTIDQNLGRYDPGLTLKQLAKLLEYYTLNVKLIYADESNEDGVNSFKENLKNTLNIKGKYILANFQGKKIGSLTSGHISPIVAYNKAKNQILILDVASHKQPWFWVDVNKFYEAMQEKDGSKSRGYLIISKTL